MTLLFKKFSQPPGLWVKAAGEKQVIWTLLELMWISMIFNFAKHLLPNPYELPVDDSILLTLYGLSASVPDTMLLHTHLFSFSLHTVYLFHKERCSIKWPSTLFLLAQFFFLPIRLSSLYYLGFLLLHQRSVFVSRVMLDYMNASAAEDLEAAVSPPATGTKTTEGRFAAVATAWRWQTEFWDTLWGCWPVDNMLRPSCPEFILPFSWNVK